MPIKGEICIVNQEAKMPAQTKITPTHKTAELLDLLPKRKPMPG